MKIKAGKIVIMALMISLALALSVVESWIPVPIPIPGIKLGLPNIITIVVIVFFGYKEALLLVILRTVMASFFTGGPVVFLFSITGGILSASVMYILFRKMQKFLSIVGISVAGAVMHNTGQLVIAVLLMGHAVLAYFPVLLISAVVTGSVVGVTSSIIIKRLEKTEWAKLT